MRSQDIIASSLAAAMLPAIAVLAAGCGPEAPSAGAARQRMRCSGPVESLLTATGRERGAIEGRLSCFVVELAAGNYLDLRARQRGADVALSALAPGGDRVLRVDRPIGRQGEESLLLWAAAMGRYQLRIEEAGSDPGGLYVLELARLGPGSPADRERAEAARQFAEAEELRRENTVASLTEALPLYGEAERRFSTLAEAERRKEVRRQWAQALTGLGELRLAAGAAEGSEAALLEAVPLWREQSGAAGLARALNALGNACRSRGNLECAEGSYREAAALYRSLGEPSKQAVALGNLGNVFLDAGEPRAALDRYEDALALLPAEAPAREHADLMAKIGWGHLQLEETATAERWFEQAHALAQEGGDRRTEAHALASLARLRYENGEHETARVRFEEVAALFRELGDRAGEVTALQNAAWCRLKQGQAAGAAAAFELSLARAQELGDPRLEAAIEAGSARAELARQDFEAARRHALAAVERIEALRAGMDRADLRRSYLADTSEAYDTAVDALLALHRQRPGSSFDDEAFALGERSRARALLDALASPASVAVGAAETGRLRARINAAEEARLGLVARNAKAAEVAAVERELRAALEELRALGRWPVGEEPALSLAGIRRELLGEDTLLLAFDLGREASVLWLVDSQGSMPVPLPPAAEIEADAEKVLRLFEADDPRAAGADAAPSVRALADLLLGPAASRLGEKRLLIVPDGALAALPFGALPEPGAGEPLLVRHEITFAPSASVAMRLARRSRQRKPPTMTLAFVGDPVYASEAQAGAVEGPGEAPAITDLARSLLDFAPETLRRLPASAREGEVILSLVPPAKGFSATRHAAAKELVTGGTLADFRIVHFAAHGLLNTSHPELSGLVLSQLDASGQPRDAYLRAHEIAALRFQAELVVLAACETARGAKIRGEGLVGLPHAFFEAGADRVLVSLWRVRDKAAAELSARFYRALLAEGLPPSAALRKAQLGMYRDPAWSRPRDWAGFVLQGPP